MLNNSAADVEKVLLSGTGWIPDVLSKQGSKVKGKVTATATDEGNELFFKPTFVSQRYVCCFEIGVERGGRAGLLDRSIDGCDWRKKNRR